EWEQAALRERPEKEFHTLNFPLDAEYINMLHDWAMSAGGKGGKEPPRWGEWEFWCRSRFPEIRKAFVGKGEGKGEVTKLEELGFDFEGDKRAQKHNL
ncbi:hypothetical protein LTS18_010336, partial [Coniosporium uncinatum]